MEFLAVGSVVLSFLSKNWLIITLSSLMLIFSIILRKILNDLQELNRHYNRKIFCEIKFNDRAIYKSHLDDLMLENSKSKNSSDIDFDKFESNLIFENLEETSFDIKILGNIIFSSDFVDKIEESTAYLSRTYELKNCEKLFPSIAGTNRKLTLFYNVTFHEASIEVKTNCLFHTFSDRDSETFNNLILKKEAFVIKRYIFNV